LPNFEALSRDFRQIECVFVRVILLLQRSSEGARDAAQGTATRRANALKSKVRFRVEHVFATQKDRMDLFVRTIGIGRATTKIGMPMSSTTSNACCSCAEPQKHDARTG